MALELDEPVGVDVEAQRRRDVVLHVLRGPLAVVDVGKEQRVVDARLEPLATRYDAMSVAALAGRRGRLGEERRVAAVRASTYQRLYSAASEQIVRRVLDRADPERRRGSRTVTGGRVAGEERRVEAERLHAAADAQAVERRLPEQAPARRGTGR